MDSQKISVQLYGDGKQVALEADELYCDRSDVCSFYSDGKCLNCRSFLSPKCKYGRVHTVKGYTKRSTKYYDFRSKYRNDPVFGELSYPSRFVARIADELYFNFGYVDVRKKRENDGALRKTINGYVISDSGFGSGKVFLPISDVSNELLYAIFAFRPFGFTGKVIKDWAERRVPKILQEMSTVVPEIYNRFVTEYPEHKKEPDYIGELVYIDSLKSGTKFTIDKNTWIYDGQYVESEQEISLGIMSPWLLQEGIMSKVRIKVNPKMTIKVTDNSIVDSETRFA